MAKGNKEARMTLEKRSHKENLSTLKNLLIHLANYKTTVFLALILTIISNFFSLTAPQLVKQAISFMELPVEEIDLSVIGQFGLLMLGFYLCLFLLTMLLSYVMMKLGQNMGFTLRKKAFSKFESLPVSFFDTHQTGDVISRFTYDIDMVSSSLAQNFMSFATSMITLIGTVTMMTGTNFTLMRTFFVTIPLSLGLCYVFTKQARKFHGEKSRKMGEINGYVEDKISGHKTIKIYGQEKNVLEQLIEKNKEWGKAHYNSEFYGASILRTSLTFVTNSTTSVLYVHSCILLLNNQLSLAEISSFILYAKMFTSVVNEITFVIADLQASLAAADRVFSFLEEEEETPDSPEVKELSDFSGEVAVNDVNFQYDSHRKILNQITIKAKPNTVTAIVGHTGAGKTTLINLLMRFYELEEGEILFDGDNVTNLSRKSLRSSCAMVLQDAWLFGSTILENIRYGTENATIEDVERVTKAITLHQQIMDLPKGYDTIITESTMNLSQGQKQLISIARAMLPESKVLILDEATSNVDTLTEINIQNAMKELMKGKTSFVIAHRLSTVRNADNIVVLDQGNIVEQGSHDDLIALGGQYAALYQSQFNVLDEIKQLGNIS
ncbi:MAG: ABC transporter ATP-binding protein [Eubacteriales bacterium]